MTDFSSRLSNDSKGYMVEVERQVREVLHNINWLLESHDSHAELIGVNGRKVIIRCTGPCSACEIDCVSAAFRDSMPNINLFYYKEKTS